MTQIAEVASVVVTSVVQAAEDIQGLPAAAAVSPAVNPGSTTYSPTSTVPVTYRSIKTWTLDGSGEATIDLTALPAMQDDIDATGLKVQLVRIWGEAGNGVLTISPGASNAYALNGAGNDLVYPAANTKVFHWEFGDTSPQITDVSGSGDSQIDLAGTAGNEFTIEILVG